jgi:hypothetical protein
VFHCRAPAEAKPHILTVGSLNVDIIIGVDRLPTAGETLMARTPSAAVAAGGKGANQAVAAARLSAGTGRASRFVTQFGNDSYAAMMEAALLAEGVDVSACGRVAMPSGQGIVSGGLFAFPFGDRTYIYVQAAASAAIYSKPPAVVAQWRPSSPTSHHRTFATSTPSQPLPSRASGHAPARWRRHQPRGARRQLGIPAALACRGGGAGGGFGGGAVAARGAAARE